MRGKCADCRFLGKVHEFDGRPTHFHLCDGIEHVESGMPRPPNQPGAFVIDGSGYWGALVVAADFGCTLFQKKT